MFGHWLFWVVVISVVITLSIVLPALVGGAYSPTRTRVVDKMLKMARIQQGDLLYDLGAGDGRIIIAATKTYGAQSIGVEIDPLRWVLCKIRVWITPARGRATVQLGNFFDMDLSEADVITFYLSQAAADKLGPKLNDELKDGSRVVSYRRPIPKWIPHLYDEEDDIFVYTVGEHVSK